MKTNMNERNAGEYFLSVADVTETFGKINEMMSNDKTIHTRYYTKRYYTTKFVKDPLLSMIITFYPEIRDTRPENLQKIIKSKAFENIIFKIDPKTGDGVYTKIEYFTTNNNTPTEAQMKKFLNGEYEFYMRKTEVQVLKTILVNKNLLEN